MMVPDVAWSEWRRHFILIALMRLRGRDVGWEELEAVDETSPQLAELRWATGRWDDAWLPMLHYASHVPVRRVSPKNLAWRRDALIGLDDVDPECDPLPYLQLLLGWPETPMENPDAVLEWMEQRVVELGALQVKDAPLELGVCLERALSDAAILTLEDLDASMAGVLPAVEGVKKRVARRLADTGTPYSVILCVIDRVDAFVRFSGNDWTHVRARDFVRRCGLDPKERFAQALRRSRALRHG